MRNIFSYCCVLFYIIIQYFIVYEAETEVYRAVLLQSTNKSSSSPWNLLDKLLTNSLLTFIDVDTASWQGWGTLPHHLTDFGRKRKCPLLTENFSILIQRKTRYNFYSFFKQCFNASNLVFRHCVITTYKLEHHSHWSVNS